VTRSSRKTRSRGADGIEVRSSMKTRVIVSLLVLVAVGIAIAQASNSASISGRIVSVTALPLRATVALSFAAARGYPAPPWRVRTNSTGAFTFSKLQAGSYSLCAQVAPAETAPANSLHCCEGRAAQRPCGRSGRGVAGCRGEGAGSARTRVADYSERAGWTLPACSLCFQRCHWADLSDRDSVEHRAWAEGAQ